MVSDEVRERLASWVDSCLACTQTCTSCADACLAEEGVKGLVRCVKLDLDCADICRATASLLSRAVAGDDRVARDLLRGCADICAACADMCAGHAEEYVHCLICAEA
ncbi:four-helix bundle copper-binding protein [Streptomyces sp. NPDC004779]